ncbi:MAG: phenylacetate--CoA ligase family protein [Gemmatimonadota bacterium]
MLESAFQDRLLVEPVHGRIYLALQALRGRPVRRCIRRLQQWESLDPAEFRQIQAERLRSMLEYARRHVPLYRSGEWGAALSRSRIDEVGSWPVLEREILRTRPDDLLAKPRRPWLTHRRSSASTGTPIRMALNLHAAAWSWASEYRAMLWHGIPIGIRTLKLWGEKLPLQDWLRGQTTFLTTDLTPARLEAAVRFLLERRPRLVWGPASAVFHLARYLREVYPDLPRPLVPFAKVGGEQLFPFQRAEIEAQMAGRVVESYGCTEVGAVAGECPAGSLHVFADHVHLEILCDGEPAEAGRFGDIVLTSLTNLAMPIVRCRLGDSGRLSPEPCPCGLPHPVLTDLRARASDLFLAADGREVHASELVNRLGAFFGDPRVRGCRQVLFVQADPRTWRVWVEVGDRSQVAVQGGERFCGAVEAGLAKLVRETFGADCRVETALVRTIPREVSGKYRYYRVHNLRGQGGHGEP